MKTVQKFLLASAVVVMMQGGMAGSAFAIDLDAARAKGVAGEMDNGLLAAPPGASAEAADLITSINNARRAEYAKIAAQNNLSLDAVGVIASQKIVAKLPAGTWIQVQGVWKKK